METFLLNNKLYTKIGNLSNWQSNPRNIDEKSFNRLKDQLSLKGQFAPLLVMPDGTVLGGNMRLKALTELGIQDIWITMVNFLANDSGLFIAELDGVAQTQTYASKEDGMLDWAMSHNDDFGWTDSELLANMMPGHQIDWSQHALTFDPPQSVQDMLDSVAPNPLNSEFKHSVVVMCDNEEQQKSLFNQLSTEGYNAEIKTVAKKSKA